MMEFDETKATEIIEGLGKIDMNNIVNELAEHAAKYGWFAVLYEKAKAKEDRLKFELKVLEAELDKYYRNTTDKITERFLDKAISNDKTYQSKYLEFLEAKRQAGILGAIVDAMGQKKDMLVSYCSIAREELRIKSGLFDVEKES